MKISHSNFISPLTDPISHVFKQIEKPKSMQIGLYDCQTIDELEWPTHTEGKEAHSFLIPLVKHGINHYIDNVETKLKLLRVNDDVFPITINDAEYDNAYICSFYGYYIGYALESLDLIKQPIIRKLAAGALRSVGKGLKWGKLNKAVVVNNWPFSTNLYPQIEENTLQAIVQLLKKEYPDHAIVFRSLDDCLNQKHQSLLQKQGFHLIASKQVYLTDGKNEEIFKTRLFKSDLRLLQKSGYEILETDQLNSKDVARVLELYSSVYIDKYSNLNPKFNTHFIALLLQQNLLKVKVLKKDNSIDGVIGYLNRYGTLFCPLFGYDTHKPQEVGLYRLLSTLLMLEAQKQQAMFHQSSGASFYKTIRKAQGFLEYTAVYTQHLSLFRQTPWLILKGISNKFAIPFMQKY